VSESLLHHISFYAEDPQFMKVLNRLKFFDFQQLIETYIQYLKVLNISKLVKQRYTVVTQYNLSQTLDSRQLVSICYQIMRRVKQFQAP
jgi:hypothetical protein